MKTVSTAPVIKRQDARFLRSERHIHQALNRILATRRISVRTAEICHAATITYPTFYNHYASSDEALKQRERKLTHNFRARLPHSTHDHEVLFTILLGFVHDERDYFRATLPTSNHWLLAGLFAFLRPRLAGCAINDKTYAIYAQTQIGIISCWARYDHFAKDRIPHYVKALRTTRFLDYGI